MAVARYRIPDEPRPTGLIRYAVDPLWPLLAIMMSGNALGLAWFAFNSRALGSVSAMREWAYIAGSLLGCVAIAFLIRTAVLSGWLPDKASFEYAALAFAALKLSLGYALYIEQARSAELVVHFGGRLRNGLFGLLLCFMFARSVIDGLELPWLVAEALR
ncbi:MAG: hypothetical protein ACOY82_10335 [Pseudomonadota bacterium]